MTTGPITSVEALLEVNEGRRGVVYDDATGKSILPGTIVRGKATIGVGCNLVDVPLTDAEIDYLRDNRIALARADLKSFFDAFEDFAPARQAALIDMRFALGSGSFRGFHGTIAAVSSQDWPTAAADIRQSLWHAEDPARVERDALMLETGEFPA